MGYEWIEYDAPHNVLLEGLDHADRKSRLGIFEWICRNAILLIVRLFPHKQLIDLRMPHTSNTLVKIQKPFDRVGDGIIVEPAVGRSRQAWRSG